MKVAKVGYGGGSRETKDEPIVLRVLVGQKKELLTEKTKDDVCVVETHLPTSAISH